MLIERKSLRKIFIQPNANPIIFISDTSNNTRALRPIWEKLECGSYSIIAENEKKFGVYFPKLLVYFYSILYSLPLIWTYFRATDSEKRIIETYFDSFFTTIAFVKLSARLIKKNKVRLVVMANDHSSLQRSFLFASRSLNVATIYTQHCSVTERFPSLQFSYSFLDGEESFIKYAKIGKLDSIVYLSGSPRFDEIVKYRKKTKANVEVIGVACNLLDEEAKVKALSLSMKQKGGVKIVVRPHPAQIIDKEWYINNGFEFSDSKKESPYEYIYRIDMLVSGESGIHLDAILMGVPSICYDMNGKGLIDWYSYVKNGLVPYLKNEEELLEFLQNYKSGCVQIKNDMVKFYNASYDSSIDGQVGNMIADFIMFYMDNAIDVFDKRYKFAKKKIYGRDVKCIE